MIAVINIIGPDSNIWYSVSERFQGVKDAPKLQAFLTRWGVSYDQQKVETNLAVDKDTIYNGTYNTQEVFELTAQASHAGVDEYLCQVKPDKINSGAALSLMGVNGPGGDDAEWLKGWMGYLPKGEQNTPLASESTQYQYCDHEWVDVGFNHSKFVCKKCNQEKP